MGALRDRERHDAINPQGCQEQCDDCEAAEERGSKAIASKRFVLDLIHRFDLRERQIRIHGLDDLGDAASQRGWVNGGAHSDGGARLGTLREGHINFGESIVARASVANVVIHADDLPRNGHTEFGDAGNDLFHEDGLDERINAIEKFLDERFVDDGYRNASRYILVGEGTAALHAHAEGFEILRRDHTEAGARTRGGIFDVGLSGDLERHAEIHAFYGYAFGGRGGGDAGECLDSFQKLAIESGDLLRIGQVTLRHRKLEGEDVIGAEAEVHVRDVPQTVNGEAAAGQEAERQRKFDNHERTAKAVPAAADTGTAAFFQYFIQVHARGLPGGYGTEKHAREQRGGDREEQH